MANTFLQAKKYSTTRKKFSIFRMLSIFCLVVISLTANSQPWTYNFGTGTGSHTSSTASTSFLPTPTSGTARVRVGTNPGSIAIVNPGISMGDGSELQITSNTGSTSPTRFSVYDYATATKVGYVKFTVSFNGGTNGVYQFNIGDGASFSDNSSMSATQIFSGIRWSFGASNAITYNVLNSSTYGTTGISSSTTLFSQSTSNSYIVEAYFNNETTSQNYGRAGSPNTIASGTWDLWIAGTLIGDDIARGGLANNVTIDSWAFNHQSSSSSPGTVYLDDIVYSNSLPISSSASSNIILNSSFTHPTNIDYTAYQAASGLTTGNSIEVGRFDIQDGGGSSDADALATTLTACSLTVANSANIRALALFDGSTNVGEITSVGATAVFSSLTLAAADNASKTFSVRATFKSAVTDNQQISFTLASATASGAGSTFAAANAGAAATTTTGDNNKIEVTADRLAFVNQPATTAANAGMSNVTVSANDINGIRDLDFISQLRITSTGTLTGTPVDVAASSGLATFVSLTHTGSGTGLTLNAERTSTTDWDITSNTFDITAAAPEINVKQNVTSLVSGSGTYAAGSIVSGNSGSAVTFTIENLGSANLTYSSITSSNTTDFTLDLTSSSTPIAASGNTTFTVVFNPTTAGAKSTTITINNNDADEGTYSFTVTGTGTVSSASDIITNSGYSYHIAVILITHQIKLQLH